MSSQSADGERHGGWRRRNHVPHFPLTKHFTDCPAWSNAVRSLRVQEFLGEAFSPSPKVARQHWSNVKDRLAGEIAGDEDAI
ncbi:MAG: hypothetical protein H6822_28480 [Planctomycetaceae bacterium]|nr:hypothetical protein [Planctomycetaceae bacterium]